MFSNTFAGIAPASVPAFVLAQLAGGVLAITALRILYPEVTPEDAAEVVVPHGAGPAVADGRLEPGGARSLT
jgi:arsenate reductase